MSEPETRIEVTRTPWRGALWCCELYLWGNWVGRIPSRRDVLAGRKRTAVKWAKKQSAALGGIHITVRDTESDKPSP